MMLFFVKFLKNMFIISVNYLGYSKYIAIDSESPNWLPSNLMSKNVVVKGVLFNQIWKYMAPINF